MQGQVITLFFIEIYAYVDVSRRVVVVDGISRDFVRRLVHSPHTQLKHLNVSLISLSLNEKFTV